MPAPYYHRPERNPSDAEYISADVVVYGGTGGGAMSAIASARRGMRTVLLCFSERVGGMVTGGICNADVGNTSVLGGLSREFYARIGARYGFTEIWTYEPHVAEEVLLQMLDEAGVRVVYRERIMAVIKDRNRLQQVHTERGSKYSAKIFVDASYEGDLMATAGVSYRVGRESNAEYSETMNGVHFGHPRHTFNLSNPPTTPIFVDPYVEPGDEDSGLLPGIDQEPIGEPGVGDSRISAYCFRPVLTDSSERIPFEKPRKYDPDRYEINARYLNAGFFDAFALMYQLPAQKWDLNNHGPCGTDYIGANHQWPEASYVEREKIYQDHVDYLRGWLFFYAHDDRVPRKIREHVQQFGFPRDEFRDTDGFPPELYVREGRRMVGDFVLTENHCLGIHTVFDGVAPCSFQIDLHNTRRAVYRHRVVNEGNLEFAYDKPYPVSYRSLVPRESECSNLLVSFAVSATHVAFGTLRMEPISMMLGQACGIAAAIAIGASSSVQDIDYIDLRQELLKAKMRLS
jgi:hypothetical protein